PAAALLAQRPAHAGSGRGELALEPAIEDAREVTTGDVLGGDLEARIHPRLDGPLAEQLRAEGVDGADPRNLELRKRVLEATALVARACRILPAAFDGCTQPQLQLAGGGVGEGDGHHAFEPCASARQRFEHAAAEGRRLSGPRVP